MIHPTAIVEDGAEIGEGTNVWAYVHIMPGARVGKNCNIGDHVFIEGGVIVGNNVTIKNGCMLWEGVTIEDGVFIGPGVIFTNDKHPMSPRLEEAKERYTSKENWLIRTLVRKGASIGAGSIIIAGNSIGEFSLVGAGSVVTGLVPDKTVVCGNPARIMK